MWTAVLSLLTPLSLNAATQTESSTESKEKKGAPLLDGLVPEIPFAEELLGGLLRELLEGGDCQHFVVLCEILRHCGLLDSASVAASIGDMRRRETYLAYFELLAKLKLFCCANTIIKASSEEYISKLSRHGVLMHTACAKCGKELPENVRTQWCVKCHRCAAMCVLCHMPVRGLMHWCPVCGHGGHLSCTEAWFKAHGTCPSGCGHDCCPPRDREQKELMTTSLANKSAFWTRNLRRLRYQRKKKVQLQTPGDRNRDFRKQMASFSLSIQRCTRIKQSMKIIYLLKIYLFKSVVCNV